MNRITCICALGAALLASSGACASDPIGGYVIVDRVLLEPSTEPTTITIWGSFVLATKPGGREHSQPMRGYMYFKAPQGMEEVCRKEWNDLQKAAGTSQVIGFGSSYYLKGLGKVRKVGDKPEQPDGYPVGNGLVKITEDTNYTPISNLRSLPIPQTPADGVLVVPGEITLVVRNIGDKNHANAKYRFELEGSSGEKEEATVEAGDKETRWAPTLKVKAGGKYTWRVNAVEGQWKGPVATASFIVKGAK
jgi:hypothetical protein